MSMYDPPTVRGDMDTKQLANLVAELIDDMAYILNGNIDSRNIRVNSITADRMNVNQLSAITADIGHITAGNIESVIITGSRVQTRWPGIYPRMELSNTSNLLSAEVSPDNYVRMNAYNPSISSPSIEFKDGAVTSNLSQALGSFSIFSQGSMSLSGTHVSIEGVNGIQFFTTGNVIFAGFNKIYSLQNGKTLQQELSDIWAAIASFQNFDV